MSSKNNMNSFAIWGMAIGALLGVLGGCSIMSGCTGFLGFLFFPVYFAIAAIQFNIFTVIGRFVGGALGWIIDCMDAVDEKHQKQQEAEQRAKAEEQRRQQEETRRRQAEEARKQREKAQREFNEKFFWDWLRQEAERQEQERQRQRSQQNNSYSRQSNQTSSRNPFGAYDVDTCYSILGCSSRTSDADLKATYHKLILKNHPDRLGANADPKKIAAATERTKEINEAFRILKIIRGLN